MCKILVSAAAAFVCVELFRLASAAKQHRARKRQEAEELRIEQRFVEEHPLALTLAEAERALARVAASETSTRRQDLPLS